MSVSALIQSSSQLYPIFISPSSSSCLKGLKWGKCDVRKALNQRKLMLDLAAIGLGLVFGLLQFVGGDVVFERYLFGLKISWCYVQEG